MEPKAVQDMLIRLLRAELNETELDSVVREQLTPSAVAALYALSKHHDLTYMTAAALRRCGAEDMLSPEFVREEQLSLYRHQQMKYAYRSICTALDAADIPYIPLKGAVIRPYYPEEIMRTSCDIDVLVREDDLPAAMAVLERNGFLRGDRGYHDVSMPAPNNVHLELHFTLQENAENLDAVLKDAWLYALPEQGSRFRFQSEFLLFHVFAHMSYHFISGGCGLRALTDVWVMAHKMGMTYTQAEALLEKAGIHTFAAEVTQLAEVCFSGAEKNELSEPLLTYILSGGVYGTSGNQIALAKARNSSTAVYALQRLCLPYRTMAVQYPILRRLPFLLPFFWLVRLCRMLLRGKTGTALAELKAADNMSIRRIDEAKQLRSRLGL